MNAVNSINTTVLDGIIVGRVDPHIYAFSTETIPNYLKVGDTYRAVEVRLDEWRRHFPKLKRIYDHTAKTDDKRIFRDYSVHTFLENERKRKRLTKNLFPKEYYSNEFFEKATKKDVEDAITDICRDAKENAGKYQFYDENHLPETYIYERKDDYKPRKNQQETIDKFKVAIGKGRDKLLMYAVMRFGKSFTSMCCADEMKADFVVVVSAKADVKEEWKKTVESHKRFVQYEFATSNNLKSNKKFISESKKAGKKIVLFLTLQDLQGKEMKDKHNELFKTKIDLLLVDESHFGARASEYGRVLQDYKLTTKQLKAERQKEVSLDELNDSLKVLKANVTMHLSGTPYRILMSDEFTDDDIVAFYQFSDIADDKEKWDKEHIDNDDVREWDNPYYGFPQMVRFAFNPCQSAVKKLNALKNAGVSYAMSELLKPQSISKDEKNNAHQKFVHAAEVLDLFKVIDGSKTDENVLGFLDYDKIKKGQMCRHIVIVLPFRASCDALEKMITNNKKIFKNLNDYQIVNIAGVDGDKTYKDIKDVKNKIQTCEAKGQKTITLTVNRMLTGSTVEQWDTMIYLKDTESPQEYDQAIFRLQNPYIKVYGEGKDAIKFNMKPQTLLVDFDVNRVFRMQEQKSQIYNVNTDRNGNSELEKRIRRELEISPIIVLNKNKLQEVEATNIMDAVREYSSSKSVADEATDIPTDYTLLANKKIRSEIEKLTAIDAKKGIEIKSYNGSGDDDFEVPEGPSNAVNPENKDGSQSASTGESTDETKELAKKLATYYSQILFYAFLTDNKVSTLTDIIADVEKSDDNRRICRNVGLSKNILIATQKHSNPFVLSKLDYKIHNINTLIGDKNIAPAKRLENAMNKFGRLGTAEIVTPPNVADIIVKQLPDKWLTPQSRILDIASKQGEFAVALFRRYGNKVLNKVYSLPTSPITYEFTLKVYKLLGMPKENVFANFTCFDLIDKNKDKHKHIKQLSDMKFDTIVGNPPYHEITAKKETSNGQKRQKSIFQYFQTLSDDLASYTSLIYPGGRWIQRSGKGMEKFGLSQINDPHLEKVIFYSNANDLFDVVGIADGISIVVKNKNKNKRTFKYEFIADGVHQTVDMSSPGEKLIPLNPSDLPIVDKIVSNVKEKNLAFLDKSILSQKLFSIESDFVETNPTLVREYVEGAKFDTKTEIKLFTNDKAGKAGRARWYVAKKDVITTGKEYLNKWKVVVSSANAGGQKRSNQIQVLDNHSAFGRARVALKTFDTEKEAQNFLAYAKSNFIRFAFLLTDEALTSLAKLVPDIENYKDDNGIIDFSKDVDKQLFELFDITKDQQDYIARILSTKKE